MAKDSKYGDIDIPGIPPDEPVFILRGQDKLATILVHIYAELIVLENPTGDNEEFVNNVHGAADILSTWPHQKRPD